MGKSVFIWIVSSVISSAFAQQPNATQGSTTVTATATAGRRDTVHNVDPGQMYHRVYARVPLVGSGKFGDPIRPMFAPVSQTASTQKPSSTAVPHSGILGYTMIISDDGNWALCEFVGATPQDLAVITSAASATVVVFSRGQSTIAEIEADFQQYKKNFTFASFEPFTTRAQ